MIGYISFNQNVRTGARGLPNVELIEWRMVLSLGVKPTILTFSAAFKNWWNYSSTFPLRRHDLHRAAVLISAINQKTNGSLL